MARNTIWQVVSIPACPHLYNLPVPPYHFPSEHVLRIGENPAETAFALSSVVQM